MPAWSGLLPRSAFTQQAAPAERLDRRQRLRRIAAPDQCQVGAGRGQRFGDRPAQAGVGAGDRRDAALQIEMAVERVAHLSTFIGTQATSLYSWFSPPIAQMKL